MSTFVEIVRGSTHYLVNVDSIRYVSSYGMFGAGGTIVFNEKEELSFAEPYESLKAKILAATAKEEKGKIPHTPLKEKGESNNNNSRTRARGKFVKPTVEEVAARIREKGYTFGAEQFWSYYESTGWKVGRNPMKDWKSACVTWQRREDDHTYIVRKDWEGELPPKRKVSDNYVRSTSSQIASEKEALRDALARN